MRQASKPIPVSSPGISFIQPEAGLQLKCSGFVGVSLDQDVPAHVRFELKQEGKDWRLLGTDTSLLAYHLPLDAHLALGNNARLAQLLGIECQGSFGHDGGMSLGQYGQLPQALTAAALGELLQSRLGRKPQHIPGPQQKIQTVGWCTGAAQSYIDAAAEQGLDAFISGEISEQTVHVARERGIHYFAAGHHATERYGVQALGQYLAEQFGISHRFIDIDNPV